MKIAGYTISKVSNTVLPPPERTTQNFKYVISAPTIAKADVSEYKQAFLAARGQWTQDRKYIYDQYENALNFDAHLTGLIERRLLSTVGRKLEYVINNEPVQGIEALTKSPHFEELVRQFLMAKVFYGMGLLEFDKEKYKGKDYMTFTSIPVKHIDPFNQMVRKYETGVSDEDKSYKNLKNVLFIGETDDFGILQQIALIALYKRAVMNDWASYSQLASTNFREIQYKGASPDPAKQQAEIDRVLNIGNGVTAYSLDDMEIKTTNQTSSSQNDLFESYINYLDETMTKLVLGQTMTTEDGSSRSQAEVHERTQEDIFDADAKSFLNFMNYQFYDIHSMYGIPDGGDWRFAESGTVKQQQQIELDLKLKELGYIFTMDEIKQRYNL